MITSTDANDFTLGILEMTLKAATLAFPILLASCSEPQCTHERAFDHWLFQQTWFISETPGTENLGAAFGDNGGTLFVPRTIESFNYCADGRTLHVSYGKYWKHREDWSIVELDEKTLTLKFQDGGTYKYYRAGR